MRLALSRIDSRVRQCLSTLFDFSETQREQLNRSKPKDKHCKRYHIVFKPPVHDCPLLDGDDPACRLLHLVLV